MNICINENLQPVATPGWILNQVQDDDVWEVLVWPICENQVPQR